MSPIKSGKTTAKAKASEGERGKERERVENKKDKSLSL